MHQHLFTHVLYLFSSVYEENPCSYSSWLYNSGAIFWCLVMHRHWWSFPPALPPGHADLEVDAAPNLTFPGTEQYFIHYFAIGVYENS